MLVSELSLTALLPSSLLQASAHGSLNTQKQMKINDCCCICVLILWKTRPKHQKCLGARLVQQCLRLNLRAEMQTDIM